MMQLGFAAAEMTKAFVSCSLGIHMVGYTMIAYGVFGGFSSWISGILCEYVGRVALISAAPAQLVKLKKTLNPIGFPERDIQSSFDQLKMDFWGCLSAT